MTSPDIKVAQAAAKKLKIEAMLSGVTNIELAQAVDVDRNTIRRWLKNGNISLSDYVSLSKRIGVNPLRILSEALTETEDNKKSDHLPTVATEHDNQKD